MNVLMRKMPRPAADSRFSGRVGSGISPASNPFPSSLITKHASPEVRFALTWILRSRYGSSARRLFASSRYARESCSRTSDLTSRFP